MSRPAPIRTERLVLRPLTVEDAAAVLRFRGDPAAVPIHPALDMPGRRAQGWT